jgi:hypothetical protein
MAVPVRRPSREPRPLIHSPCFRILQVSSFDLMMLQVVFALWLPSRYDLIIQRRVLRSRQVVRGACLEVDRR